MTELFDEKGCLTDEGLHALTAGGLTELQRLEAAEHLAYCDACLERYTALLTPQTLETPRHSVAAPVIRSVWVRVMQSTYGRAAVAAVAAVLALTFWTTGSFRAPDWQSTELQKQQSAAQSAFSRAFNDCEEYFSNSLHAVLSQHGGAANENRGA